MAAPEAASLPHHLVFVDLETTGGNAAHDRITEVGIVRMQHGIVVEEWSSLVNPQCLIPAAIQACTGITNDMVATAPSFREIAGEVLARLEDAAGGRPLFVAHNARFDYGFLRAEYRRLGTHFSAAVLCTVKLSRRLYPQFARHNLDAVMQRHQLSCSARHRALGDARVLGDLWRKLLSEVPDSRLAGAVAQALNAHRLPASLPEGLADELPEGPGVYRFFGADDALLYIGRSASLRARILAHFTAAAGKQPQADPNAALAAEVRRIDWLETAGELGARLRQAEWIRVQGPRYNKQPKSTAGSCTLQLAAASQGVYVAPLDELAPAELETCFGVFHSQNDARKALTEIARAQGLCLKVLGLEAGPGSCVAHVLGRCKGACVGKEPRELHELRLRTALSALKLKPWPFPGRVALREGAGEYLVLERWMYLGTARCQEELDDLSGRPLPATFDIDVYRVLVRHLAKRAPLRWQALDAAAHRSRVSGAA